MGDNGRLYTTGQITNADMQFGYLGQMRRMAAERAVAISQADPNHKPMTPTLHDPTPADVYLGQKMLADKEPGDIRKALLASRNWRVNFEGMRTADVTRTEREATEQRGQRLREQLANPQNYPGIRQQPQPKPPKPDLRRSAPMAPGTSLLAKPLQRPGTTGAGGVEIGAQGDGTKVREAAKEIKQNEDYTAERKPPSATPPRPGKP